MCWAERTLALVLRAVGLVAFLVIVPTFMPFAWMGAIHEWLGLGHLPDATIVPYLARSTSLLYAAHGAVVVYVSFDVRRYLPALSLLAWVPGLCGLSLLWIDVTAGMPWFWTVSEGPCLLLAAGVVAWLTRRIKAEAPGVPG